MKECFPTAVVTRETCKYASGELWHLKNQKRNKILSSMLCYLNAIWGVSEVCNIAVGAWFDEHRSLWVFVIHLVFLPPFQDCFNLSLQVVWAEPSVKCGSRHTHTHTQKFPGSTCPSQQGHCFWPTKPMTPFSLSQERAADHHQTFPSNAALSSQAVALLS